MDSGSHLFLRGKVRATDLERFRGYPHRAWFFVATAFVATLIGSLSLPVHADTGADAALNVTMIGPAAPGKTTKVAVSWTGKTTEWVEGWMDLDGNGLYASDELVLKRTLIDDPITVLEITVPSWAKGLAGVELVLIAESSGLQARAKSGSISSSCAWSDEFYINGVNSPVYSMAVFDDDGTGPNPPALYVGGYSISAAGRALARGVARWDGSSWSTVGTGLGGSVRALVVFDDDGTGPDPAALYAGGGFPGSPVRKWTGTTWESVGSLNWNGDVYCLAVFDTDGSGPNPPELYAGGDFTPWFFSSDLIARWNGTTWSEVGYGLDGDFAPCVKSMAVHDGSLYVGGTFTKSGNSNINNVARWSGSSWSALGSGTNGAVNALVSHHDGISAALYAGGTFTNLGGSNGDYIAKWSGSSWSALGTGIAGGVWPSITIVRSLASFDEVGGPSLYVGGQFTTAGGTPVANIAKWQSSSWSAVDGGMNDQVFALAPLDLGSGARLFAGGEFGIAGSAIASKIAYLDGSSWTALTTGGQGFDGVVYDLVVWHDGSKPVLVAGGNFTTAGTVAANNVAAWDGSSWSPLGSGVDSYVRSLAAFDDDPDDETPAYLYAGGLFTSVAEHVAVWDGSSWSQVGDGLDDSVYVLETIDLGAGPVLYAGGEFEHSGAAEMSKIAAWDGSSWSAMGDGMNSSVGSLAVFDHGSGPKLYAAGYFTTADGNPANRIARWTGTAWEALGSGLNSAVYGLGVYDDGSGAQLYVTGAFTTANGFTAYRIARFNGSSWSYLDTSLGLQGGSGDGLAVFDDGSGAALYVGGTFTSGGGVAAERIVRWESPNSWSALGEGITANVYDLAVYDDGSGPALYAAGFFSRAGGNVSDRIAKWTCTCECSLDLAAGLWYLIGMPCATSPSSVGDLFGDDLGVGSYGSSWAVFERNEASNVYRRLGLEDSVDQGDGYWIKTLIAETIDASGTPSPTTCPQGSQFAECDDVPLIGNAAGVLNMKSHPFSSPVPWAEVRFVDEGGNEYSPSQADALGLASSVFYKWNGGGYDPYDDNTSGMLGTLESFDGIWVEAFQNLTLRIPSPSEVASSMSMGAEANPAPTKGMPVRPSASDGWVVRVIASSGDLIDRGNVLGQLPDSVDGYDHHDLQEMPPFGNPHLTVVFPHQWGDWGTFASDFHDLELKKPDRWRFEVRSDDPTREVTLSFEGPRKVLDRAQLVDDLSGLVLPLKNHPTFTFTMGSTVRSFRWRLHGGKP